MAYNAPAVSPVIRINSGRRYFFYSVSETDAGAASEFTLLSAPPAGQIVLYVATKTAGTAATIQPKIGRATNPTSGTQAYICGQTSAAASIHDASDVEYDGVSGTIYVRSGANAGADNAIVTEITIVEGAP